MSFSGSKSNPPTHLIRTPAYPEYLNAAGYVDAAHVLKLIDLAGSMPALEQARSKDGLVVTASLDRTSFIQPIRVWEMIKLESRITRVWKSSLETHVKVTAENIGTGESRDIANAHLVFVALAPKTRHKMDFPPYEPKTWTDRQLAKGADLRKQNRKEEGKVAPFIPIEPLSDRPVTTLRQEMTPLDANAQGNVFGGIILSLIDRAGSEVARQQALNEPVIGVSQDRMSFIGPTFIGETVETKAIITRTWTTSMEVQVEIEAVNPVTETRRKVASSYVVYVRLGANGKPAEVPPWMPQTELQHRRAEAADVRRKIRQEELAHGADFDLPATSWLTRTAHWLKTKFQ